MFWDGTGGYTWYYCEDKRIAERYTAGMKNTEVIEITDLGEENGRRLRSLAY
jgi:hypothetical protein